MTTYYYNSSAAGTYLESDGSEYVWAVGNDSNDGLSRSTPFLTPANMSTNNDGHTHIFNQGSYSYTADSGRWIAGETATLQSAQATDDSVLFDFVGTGATQGLRTLSAASGTPRTLTVGRGITFSGSGTIARLTAFEHTGTGTYTYNLACRFNITSNLTHVMSPTDCYEFTLNCTEGFGVSCSDGSANLSGGFIRFGPIRDSVVNIQYFSLDWTAGDPGALVINLNYPANAGGSLYSVYPHGQMNCTNGSLSHIFRALNPPDGATVEVKNSFTLTLSSPSTTVDLCRFYSPSAEVSQSDNCLMYREFGNNAKITTNAQEGHGFLMGSDSDTDTDGIDGHIINIDLSAGAYVTGSFHGVMHGGSTGTRQYNRVDNVGIGSISKNGVAISVANEIHRVNTTDGEYCFAKGTSAGTKFIGDRCYIYADTAANITRANKSGLQDAQTPEFIGIQVIKRGNGNPTGIINYDGASGDATESIHENIFLDSNLDLSAATWFTRGTTDYTITQSEALVSNPFVGTIEQSSKNPGIPFEAQGIFRPLIKQYWY